MDVNNPTSSQNSQLRRAAGCCAGQAIGCGFSFLAGWLGAWLISALIVPLFGADAGSTLNTLLSGLSCLISLMIGALISFLAGRLFPIFQKKGGGVTG